MIGNFEITKPKYDFIVKNIIFNEPKKEKEIFDLCSKGYNNNEIGYKVGMSSRTVYRRKKDILDKILHIV